MPDIPLGVLDLVPIPSGSTTAEALRNSVDLGPGRSGGHPPGQPTSARQAGTPVVDGRFVGTPGRVADRLEQLQEATDADELLITTITHDHLDRARSYELLADEWRRRGHSEHHGR